MTDVAEPGPFPDIDTQQQIPAPALPMVPVPVTITGPSATLRLPNRQGPAITAALTTTIQHVLGQDTRRARTTLICDQDWRYSTVGAGSGVPWYAKVPLVVEHCDAIYASVPTGTGTLTVIAEYIGT